MKRYFLFVLLLLTNRLFALEKVVSADSIKYHLDPVFVIASKLAAAQREVAASVSVINSDLIGSVNGATVLDAVRDFVPGVFISERTVMGYGVATGAAGGISIRGVGGSPTTGVLVLRDGRPDMMGLMGHPLPDTYPLYMLERIEVIRGPASFLYGTNAMGGVINLVSKRIQQNGFQSRISGSLGSFTSRNLVFMHGAKFNRVEYFFTAGFAHTNGHRSYSKYDGQHYTAHFSYQLSRYTRAQINANYADITLFDPGPISAPFSDHWYDLNRYGADLGLSHQSSWGESYLQMHGNFGRHRIYDGFRSQDQTVGLLLYHHIKPWTNGLVTFGFDLKQYGGYAEKVTTRFSYGHHFVTEYAGYFHVQQLVWRRWLFSAGLRWENPYQQLLPKFGLVLNVTSAWSIRLSAAKGFRNPSIRELYLFPAPNPDLQAEEMWNYEVGSNFLIGQHLKLEAVFFRAEGEKLIRLIGQWPNVQLNNSGHFVHTGYELNVEWHPLEFIQAGMTWSKLNTGKETLNSPGKKLTIFAGCKWRRWQLLSHLMQVWDLYGADEHEYPLNDYLIVGGTLSYRMWRHLGIKAVCSNALNTHYQTLYQYPMPGRSMKIELDYSFEGI